ncbi:MAG: hypothetical protein EBR02_09510 [Alphaproteobacteria bacterium]|nr:hypothetical protein [Alphaproteobacteria bacterium]
MPPEPSSSIAEATVERSSPTKKRNDVLIGGTYYFDGTTGFPLQDVIGTQNRLGHEVTAGDLSDAERKELLGQLYKTSKCSVRVFQNSEHTMIGDGGHSANGDGMTI